MKKILQELIWLLICAVSALGFGTCILKLSQPLPDVVGKPTDASVRPFFDDPAFDWLRSRRAEVKDRRITVVEGLRKINFTPLRTVAELEVGDSLPSQETNASDRLCFAVGENRLVSVWDYIEKTLVSEFTVEAAIQEGRIVSANRFLLRIDGGWVLKELKTGKSIARWSSDYTHSDWRWNSPSSNLMVFKEKDDVVALDIDSGIERFRVRGLTSTGFADLTSDGQLLIVALDNDRLACYQCSTGTQLWSLRCGYPSTWMEQMVSDPSVLVLREREEKCLRIIAVKDGRELFRLNYPYGQMVFFGWCRFGPRVLVVLHHRPSPDPASALVRINAWLKQHFNLDLLMQEACMEIHDFGRDVIHHVANLERTSYPTLTENSNYFVCENTDTGMIEAYELPFHRPWRAAATCSLIACLGLWLMPFVLRLVRMTYRVGAKLAAN